MLIHPVDFPKPCTMLPSYKSGIFPKVFPLRDIVSPYRKNKKGEIGVFLLYFIGFNNTSPDDNHRSVICTVYMAAW
jgi:hypothetical protein